LLPSTAGPRLPWLVANPHVLRARFKRYALWQAPLFDSPARMLKGREDARP
jgi:hypothetical protein